MPIKKKKYAWKEKFLFPIKIIPIYQQVSVAVFCLKTVRYAMYMWLPLFLLQHLGYSKTNAGMFSTMFEIGGIFGSASIGPLLNKYFDNKVSNNCLA